MRAGDNKVRYGYEHELTKLKSGTEMIASGEKITYGNKHEWVKIKLQYEFY